MPLFLSTSFTFLITEVHHNLQGPIQMPSSPLILPYSINKDKSLPHIYSYSKQLAFLLQHLPHFVLLSFIHLLGKKNQFFSAVANKLQSKEQTLDLLTLNPVLCLQYYTKLAPISPSNSTDIQFHYSYFLLFCLNFMCFFSIPESPQIIVYNIYYGQKRQCLLFYFVKTLKLLKSTGNEGCLNDDKQKRRMDREAEEEREGDSGRE